MPGKKEVIDWPESTEHGQQVEEGESGSVPDKQMTHVTAERLRRRLSRESVLPGLAAGRVLDPVQTYAMQ